MVRGRLLADSGDAVPEPFRAWADQIHTRPGEEGTYVVALKRLGPAPSPRPFLHLALFVLAFLSATVAGGFLQGVDALSTTFAEIGGTWVPVPTELDLASLRLGLPFSLAFIGILLGHELGHYFAARRHRIPVSLPYFIPFPPYFSIVGTLGAFIRLRGPMAKRSVLFDIGVAGPVVSFVLSVPVLVVGLGLSEVIPTSGPSPLHPFMIQFLGEPIRIGTSALLVLITNLSVPEYQAGYSVSLHPLAFAGWLGIFVTALNLLPLGQLDGGHILYAMLGERQRWFGWGFVALMAPLGLVWWGWWLWGGIAVAVSRGRIGHPPVLMDGVEIDRKRLILGWAAVIVFVACFSPAPLSF